MPVFTFHGFGRMKEDYIRFTRPFEKDFTFYSMDIFFHGKSSIGSRQPVKEPISKKELADFFLAFAKENGIKTFALMGYSLGGRISLCLAESLPERVSAVYLFAPDGLIVNRWYALLSHYSVGRAFFRFFKNNNSFFYSVLKILHGSGIISDRVREFVVSQIDSPEKQEQVYHVWCFLRKIEPDFKILGKALEKNSIPVDLFFGYYDKIIPRKNARRLEKDYPAVNIHNLRSGHIILTGANGRLIFNDNLLSNPK